MERLYPTGPIDNLMRQISRLQRFRVEKKDRFEELTGREVEILTLVARGLKNPAIAKKLDISRVTVQNHRARIRDKLNIQSQSDYIKYGLAYDLIQL
ncbi:MAG: helix-turn-helix transcriptional regulator [Gracilimonas sp.]|uniref:helix-turn-helix domain-containing protein n=1 Tax=Gracilimonas sp. TaxID=1974203 RepID=UPI00198DDC67|nr:helix-turn-helix transcriptional regulator [Gracilimonas sp.]MBD3616905.1 helix-turn-helix transcriptional regulator [Gracilimonas sp.]